MQVSARPVRDCQVQLSTPVATDVPVKASFDVDMILACVVTHVPRSDKEYTAGY